MCLRSFLRTLLENQSHGFHDHPGYDGALAFLKILADLFSSNSLQPNLHLSPICHLMATPSFRASRCLNMRKPAGGQIFRSLCSLLSQLCLIPGGSQSMGSFLKHPVFLGGEVTWGQDNGNVLGCGDVLSCHLQIALSQCRTKWIIHVLLRAREYHVFSSSLWPEMTAALQIWKHTSTQSTGMDLFNAPGCIVLSMSVWQQLLLFCEPYFS